VIERLRALELDLGPILEAAGAARTLLDDPDARIPHVVALAVWREAARWSGDDAFGIHTAEQIRPGAFDVLDYATRCSATLGAGLKCLVRYHRILHDAAVVRLSVEGERASLTHALPRDGTGLPRHTAEFIVAAWLVVARQATGVDLVPLEVSFCHQAPSDLTEHGRVFRAPIAFERPTNGLVLPRASLDTPLVDADRGLCAVLERHMQDLLAKAPAATAFSDRVRQVVAGMLIHGGADAETVAGRLKMSRRTLQRRLQADGTSFRGLVDSLRRDLAMRYLCEREVAIAEVAFLLGFSEASAFHRAFRRWSGTTPSLYRKTPARDRAMASAAGD
jgi:AraC-like DNA-binding protein